jgi:DNA-binding response OmpR family regulator
VIGDHAGWQLLAELRREAYTRAIPVVIVSTAPRLIEQAKANRAMWGGDRFLAAPFEMGELLGVVIDLIGPA